MPHPVMFDDDDPLLARVREIALGFPGASERVSHGRPRFLVTKTFASYGASTKQTGPMVAVDRCVLVKVDESDRAALLADGRFFLPAYVGVSGWLGLDFTAATVDWDEVGELVDASYRLTAPKKSIAELDQRRPT
jgi:hypothetical protein